MFPTVNSSSEVIIYDFECEENIKKCKKLFTCSLQKVLSQLHPNVFAREDALDYLETLIIRLLAMLCASPPPHSIQDVESRVLKTFPNPIDQLAIEDAQAAVKKGRKKLNLMLPVDKIHSLLRDILQTKIDYQVTLYIVAVLENISANILKLAGNYVKNVKLYEVAQQDIRVAMCADKFAGNYNYVKNIKLYEVGQQDIRVAMCADKELMDMFHQNAGTDDSILGPLVEEPTNLHDGSMRPTYDELVKDLICNEKSYIRELHMIRKVFRDKLYQIPAIVGSVDKKNLDAVFSNINEIYEFSVNILGSLEDTLEVTKEEELPAIGTCFEELAEGAEFDVYAKYGADVLKPECVETLLNVVSDPGVSNALTTAGHGFREAVKYYLPRLLLVPVNHVFSYFKYIELLLSVADNEETKESLEQVKGLLWPLQSQLDRAIQASPYNVYLKRKLGEINSIQWRASRKANLQKLHDIQKSIEGWEGKDITQCCSEFILEGPLKFGRTGRKQSDRHVFLFDGLIVLCKAKGNEFKFKEKFLMRMVEIIDKDYIDVTCEVKHGFEIRPRDQPPVILSAKSVEEKNNWMAALVRLNTQSMLERKLDSILLDEEKQQPLRLPDPPLYPFSVQDSEENIIIEERENSGTPA